MSSPDPDAFEAADRDVLGILDLELDLDGARSLLASLAERGRWSEYACLIEALDQIQCEGHPESRHVHPEAARSGSAVESTRRSSSVPGEPGDGGDRRRRRSRDLVARARRIVRRTSGTS